MSVTAITRQQWLDDVTHSAATTFLGLTLGCAKCHDHKFDPIPTNDYYRVQAAFATTAFAKHPLAFLQEEGWSVKALHRIIMASDTHQRASNAPDGTVERDPENGLLSYFTPRRVEAEVLRDSMLAVAGELSLTTGGPGTYPRISRDAARRSRKDRVVAQVAALYPPQSGKSCCRSRCLGAVNLIEERLQSLHHIRMRIGNILLLGRIGLQIEEHHVSSDIPC